MLTFKVANQFFDRAAVIGAMDKATRAALSKAGAFIRRRAQTSMRYRKETSRPGDPPSAHKPNQLLRKNLFFSYDKESRSVVVGPVRLNGSTNAPRTLEYGGTALVVRRKRNFRGTGPGATVSRRVVIAPRPYMQPALENEAPKFPSLFRNTVKAKV